MKRSLLPFLSLFVFLGLVLGLVLGGSYSCAPFRDSPYSDQILHPERDLNARALHGLFPIEADGKIRMAVLADSHQNYKALDQVIQHINRTQGIDFVVHLGDFTNSGYNLEYDQFLESYLYLKAPFFTVIGNHDALGAGIRIFKKVFGPPNFWFETESHRLVFFNSANLETPEEFRPLWLKNSVENSIKPVVIFTHAPLSDVERFKDASASLMRGVIEHPRTRLILNGHNHVFNFTVDRGTVCVQCPRPEKGQWLLVEIQGTQLRVTRMDQGTDLWAPLKN